MIAHSTPLVASGPAGVGLDVHAEEGASLVSDAEMLSFAGRNFATPALSRNLASRIEAEVERRVLKRYAELKASNGALESFTCSVAHDLRAPLRSIDFFSALLAEKAAELDDESALALGRIRSANERMNAMISDLLEFSRVSSTELCRTPIDLSAMAREVMNDLRTAAAERKVEWRIEPGIVAYGDAGLIRLVLENLLGNAFKYSRNSGTACIEFGCTRLADGGQEMFVRDNGAGFDMKFASKLFVAFQRLHRAEEFEGTGVGLATVCRIVERHGGRVGAVGETGKGATFTFVLPECGLQTGTLACLRPSLKRDESWLERLSVAFGRVSVGLRRVSVPGINQRSALPVTRVVIAQYARARRLRRELDSFSVSGCVLFGFGMLVLVLACILA